MDNVNNIKQVKHKVYIYIVATITEIFSTYFDFYT